jgi:hypothetical protein
MAWVGRGLMLFGVDGDIVQAGRQQPRKLSCKNSELSGSCAMRFTGYGESIAAAKETVESPESIGSYSVQLANVAHNLDLVSILEDIEEYQFAPGQSIGTYPSINNDSVIFYCLIAGKMAISITKGHTAQRPAVTWETGIGVRTGILDLLKPVSKCFIRGGRAAAMPCTYR